MPYLTTNQISTIKVSPHRMVCVMPFAGEPKPPVTAHHIDADKYLVHAVGDQQIKGQHDADDMAVQPNRARPLKMREPVGKGCQNDRGDGQPVREKEAMQAIDAQTGYADQ